MDELREKIKEIVDSVYYQGVDAGGSEYGTEYWTAEDDTDQLLTLFQEELKEREKETVLKVMKNINERQTKALEIQIEQLEAQLNPLTPSSQEGCDICGDNGHRAIACTNRKGEGK